jgi:hypothetical protein
MKELYYIYWEGETALVGFITCNMVEEIFQSTSWKEKLQLPKIQKKID